jgi:hypothetical protein
MLRRLSIFLLAAALALIAAPAAQAGHRDDPRSRNLVPLGHTGDNRPVTSFADPFFTDLAFWGRYAIQGIWMGGFRVVDVANPVRPRVLSEVDCGVFQGDVGVYGNLVFRSVDFPMRATTDQETCANESLDVLSPTGGFEGIQIFRVRNWARPRRATWSRSSAPTAGPTRTRRPRPAQQPRAPLRLEQPPGAELPAFGVGVRQRVHGGARQVPDRVRALGAPERARVIRDVPLGPGVGREVSSDCHDIGVLWNAGRRLAACAGEHAIIWDISNPARPRYLRHFTTRRSRRGTRPRSAGTAA